MSKFMEQTEAMRRFLLISPLLEPGLTEAEASARRRALLAILAGQPELRTTLKLEAMAAIAQRIHLRAHLPALTPEESTQYIQHHLAQAGATGPLFTEPALRVIHASTGGIPRLLNNVGSACLLYAYTHQRQLIDDALVKEVLDTEFA